MCGDTQQRQESGLEHQELCRRHSGHVLPEDQQDRDGPLSYQHSGGGPGHGGQGREVPGDHRKR